MVPFPHQLAGARFLAGHRAALLADEQRVGKTGAAIIAADYAMAETILVVTTPSGRPVWKRGFDTWSVFNRPVQVLTKGSDVLDSRSAVVIVGWPSIVNPVVRSQLLKRRWSLIIADEAHRAKSFDAARTKALYGTPVEDGAVLATAQALISKADSVWPMTGTPVANCLNDLYPMMRALCPGRLKASGDMPDVTTYPAFLKRYCVVKPKKIGFHRWIDVVIGSRNEAELRARLDGFVLRRTQQDVGIRAPIFETFPLTVSDKARREAEDGLDTAKVLAAAEAGDTKALEMHLGPLRRLTGEIKARAVVQAVEDEFDGGLDKIVLMRWHTEPGRILREGLARYGVVTVDGSTSPRDRETAERRFREDPCIRVFDGQIAAAGEAIDLSAASELVFVEASFVPSQMAQAAQRVSNHGQTKQTRVRVAVLDGSIDEALQQVLLRKWSAIREVMTNA